MSELTDYLNKYYASSLEGLEEKMLGHFGIDIKRSSNFPKLWQFKYNQITVKWCFPLSHVCRGIIVEHTGTEWKDVSFPFSKFFNLGEPFCKLYVEDYEANPGGYFRFEKADGTCIQVYYYEGDWRVSTLGTIVTMGNGGSETSFEELFWQTLERNYKQTREEFKRKLDQLGRYTYIFELCTTRNRIVTKYTTDRVYLLGIRELINSFRVLTAGEIDVFAEALNVRRPRYESCFDLSKLSDLQAFVEKESEPDILEIDPEVQYVEGYVIYASGTPIAKIKNKKYVTLHAIIGGENDRYVAKELATHFFSETLDDIIPALSDHHLAGVEKMKDVTRELQCDVLKIATELAGRLQGIMSPSEKEAKKTYALWVQELTEKIKPPVQGWVRGYFYQNFKIINEGMVGDFTGHLQREMLRTRTNIDYWKEIILSEVEEYFKTH